MLFGATVEEVLSLLKRLPQVWNAGIFLPLVESLAARFKLGTHLLQAIKLPIELLAF